MPEFSTRLPCVQSNIHSRYRRRSVCDHVEICDSRRRGQIGPLTVLAKRRKRVEKLERLNGLRESEFGADSWSGADADAGAGTRVCFAGTCSALRLRSLLDPIYQRRVDVVHWTTIDISCGEKFSGIQRLLC